jgi:hypothetical protein
MAVSYLTNFGALVVLLTSDAGHNRIMTYSTVAIAVARAFGEHV